jgi:Fe-S-cluster containining protein
VKECNLCGKCCSKYSNGGLSALQSEVKHWDVFRPDIYAYVNEGKIWMHPDTGEQLEICPWLENEKGSARYTCAIYYDRPDDCRHYPVTVEQMINDECEMLEERDLAHPEQAQKKLDKLMVDSRPSLE